MYFERKTQSQLSGLGASAADIAVASGLLSTWFPSIAPQIQQTAAAINAPATQAQATQAAATAAAANPPGMSTDKIMLYGGIGLGVVALAFVLLRR